MSGFLNMARRRIGWTSPARTFSVGAGEAMRWGEVIGDLDPTWCRELPPTLLVSRRPNFWDELFPEAANYGTQWLNGGDTIRVARAPLVDEAIRSSIRLEEVSLRSGRSGELLVFEARATFSAAAGGELLCTIDGIIIRR